MKRVLIFSLTYYPTFVGGAEVAIKAITDRINDIEFHLVTLRFDRNQPREEKIGNVYVHRVGWGKRGLTTDKSFSFAVYISKIFFVPLAAYTAFSLNRKKKFDGLWAMMTYMAFPISLMRLVGVRVPYAITLQDGDPFERVFDRWYIKPVKGLLLNTIRRATVVQTISHFLADWAHKARYGGEVAVIPNGVDTAHFAQTYPAKAIDDIKIELNKKMGDVCVITTSRLVHKNAVDVMIEALQHLPENIHFIILGTGPDEEMLRTLAKKCGVESRVQFVGFVPHADMPKYLRACDIFVRTSRSEGMGASFVEAMAAGLPVVATQEGGIADFLFDEKRNPNMPVTGFAVDRDSPGQTAQAIREIIAHPEKTRAVVATAKQMVVEKYDWGLVAKDMRERVFERLFICFFSPPLS